MFCSGCGRQLEAGQGFCPQCGRVTAPLTPPVVPAPGFEYELERYASKVRVLGVLWLVWAGILAPGVTTIQCSRTGSDPHSFTSRC